MGLFSRARNRLLRVPAWTTSQLSQELYSILGSDVPVDVDSPIQSTGGVTINGGDTVGGITINRQGDGTTINFGDKTTTTIQGPTIVGGDFQFAPQSTTVVNPKGDPVSLDDYLKGQTAAPQDQVPAVVVLFGTVAEDTGAGPTQCSVVLEGDERVFVDPQTVTVNLFKIHAEDSLHTGDVLTVFRTLDSTGAPYYKAQPPTWLG